MRRLSLILIILLAGLVSITSPALARSNYSRSYKGYSSSRLPRYNSNPHYIVPRSQIPVPKSERVNPYFKRNGIYVPGYLRAPYGSLKPWYNPLYQKNK